jgi:predicted nucleic acid-binding protein
MTVLIDSWAWIEYWKGGESAKRAAGHIEGDEEAVVSTINLAEVYFWIGKYYDDATAKEKLAVVEKRCFVIPVERDLALEAARLKARHKLALADSLILATAKQTGAKVVTGDPDFDGLDNVILLT